MCCGGLQGQGKGARPTEKCGVCVHCTRPALRKGCLNPIVRSDNPNEAPELQSKCAPLSCVCHVCDNGIFEF